MIPLLLLVRATYTVYRCCSSRTFRPWWITHSTQRQRRGCSSTLSDTLSRVFLCGNLSHFITKYSRVTLSSRNYACISFRSVFCGRCSQNGRELSCLFWNQTPVLRTACGFSCQSYAKLSNAFPKILKARSPLHQKIITFSQVSMNFRDLPLLTLS